VGPSVAAVVMLYIDSLQSLTAQARSSSNSWPLMFREDKRFSKLHKFLGKILCVPATSDVVERLFSHRGLFMRPHTIRYDTIEEFNVDSKAEYTA